ncbi:YezD family protein [Novosphingobium rosa]|uniref:YezD family protein n=1 Tax=Novosphingobium rosa TaxID=76978 RepID=UPI00082B25EE|nr:YezD family protein [Novosphingobium rosa]
MTIPIQSLDVASAALDSKVNALDTTLAEVRGALQRLDYGHIAITIHAGKVVQIDVTEKKRFV